MALLSKSCVYGIRSALYIAAAQDASDDYEYVSIRTISEELDISFHFLTKILQTLTQAEMMESHRGPSGGIRLAQPSDQITLLDILQAIEGPELLGSCLLGLPDCCDAKPCPLHYEWQVKREQIKAMLSKTTLNEISSGLHTSEFRISASGDLSFVGNT